MRELPPRCLEILQLTANGLNTKEAAEKLFISVETVKTHKKRIIAMLEARNMTHAIAIGFRKHYIV